MSYDFPNQKAQIYYTNAVQYINNKNEHKMIEFFKLSYDEGYIDALYHIIKYYDYELDKQLYEMSIIEKHMKIKNDEKNIEYCKIINHYCLILIEKHNYTLAYRILGKIQTYFLDFPKAKINLTRAFEDGDKVSFVLLINCLFDAPNFYSTYPRETEELRKDIEICLVDYEASKQEVEKYFKIASDRKYFHEIQLAINLALKLLSNTTIKYTMLDIIRYLAYSYVKGDNWSLIKLFELCIRISDIHIVEKYIIPLYEKKHYRATITLSQIFSKNLNEEKMISCFNIPIHNKDCNAMKIIAHNYDIMSRKCSTIQQNKYYLDKKITYLKMAFSNGDMEVLQDIIILYFKLRLYDNMCYYIILGLEKNIPGVQYYYNTYAHEHCANFIAYCGEQQNNSYIRLIGTCYNAMVNYYNKNNNNLLAVQNYEKMIDTYKIAIEYKDTLAFRLLGNHFRDNEKYDIMMPFYQQSINDNMIFHDIANYYKKIKNYPEMIRNYEISISHNVVISMVELGHYYRENTNIKKMFEYYMMAIKRGNHDLLRHIQHYDPQFEFSYNIYSYNSEAETIILPSSVCPLLQNEEVITFFL